MTNPRAISGPPRCRPKISGHLALATLLAAGCSGNPPRPEDLASRFGFERQVQLGAEFTHIVFTKAPMSAPAGALHVYIEGDGTPYVARHDVAADPTPRNPLMLRLMTLDPAPSIYVGRPCYFGLAGGPPCTPRDWTLDRFSPRIVDSMARVIEQARAARETEAVELYGHSGGGALAVLLAARLGGVQRIVTIGGNLDTDAWAAYHGYTPLDGSLNPVRGGPLPASLVQQHFVGDQDKVVPPEIVAAAARRLGAPGVVVLHGVSHAHGWDRAWPSILVGEEGVSTAGAGSAKLVTQDGSSQVHARFRETLTGFERQPD